MIRALACLGCVLVTGCWAPPVPVGEQRGITFNHAVASRDKVVFSKDGVDNEKGYLAIDWNLRHDDGKSAKMAMADCIRALREEGESSVKQRCGLGKASIDYAAIVVFRAGSEETGTFELGAILPVADLFSEMPIDKLIASGHSSNAPVILDEAGTAWDFSWEEDQIVANYGGVRLKSDETKQDDSQ